jgi:RNA polymerase sigma-70 factor (ECF subfamily)
VANVQLAEDLASEVFLKVLESIDSFTFRGIPLSAWLFRLARNLLIDYFRTSPRPGVEVPLEEEVVLTEGGPDAALERKVTRKQLLGALSNLTEDQQEVVVLKFMEGFSNTVAKIVGKSEGAVKSLQHRALSTLSRIWIEVSPDGS